MIPERRLSRAEAEAVVARAIELDARAAEHGFTVDQVRHIAEEMGVSRASIEASLRESSARPARATFLDRFVGPARVVVERSTPRPAAAVTADLHRRLERLNLTRWEPDGRVWVQRLDWWPDAHRISAPTVIEVHATPAVGSRPTVLRVGAKVDDARRNHVASAVAGAGLLSLAVVGVPVALLAATAFGAVLGAIGSYRLRVRGMERRIRRMLDVVAAPSA